MSDRMALLGVSANSAMGSALSYTRAPLKNRRNRSLTISGAGQSAPSQVHSVDFRCDTATLGPRPTRLVALTRCALASPSTREGARFHFLARTGRISGHMLSLVLTKLTQTALIPWTTLGFRRLPVSFVGIYTRTRQIYSNCVLEPPSRRSY